MKIKIDHITKIEGHAGFEADLFSGKIKNALVRTKEGARLTESILRGRHFHEAVIITPRICGVCPVVHNLTAIKAIENALGVKVSEQTVRYRKILELAQIIHSHALHAYFMAAGDYFGLDNGLDLVAKFPKASQTALIVRDFTNRLIKVIGGRTVHPLTTQVGGFTQLPDKKHLENFVKEVPETLKSINELVKIYKKITFPKFERQTEFLSLSSTREYAIYEGNIKTTDGLNIAVKNFEHNIEEIQIPFQMSKRAHYKGNPYMVGALARINLNAKQLNKQAKWHLKLLPKLPVYNTFYNLSSQLIEIIHSVEEIEKLLLKLINAKNEKPSVKYKVIAGRGVGSVEAPRGTLYHYYELDKQGVIINCNIITPTVQMLANMEADLTKWLSEKKFKQLDRDKKIKMLIRAYDPCMTCATH